MNEKRLRFLFEKRLEEARSNLSPEYKNALVSIEKYIKNAMQSNTGFRFPQSSRHDDEVCRIDVKDFTLGPQSIVSMLTELFNTNTEDGFYVVPNVKNPEAPIYVKTDWDAGPGPSGMYKAYKLELYSKNGDDYEQLPHAFITNAALRMDGKKAGAKKMFTPNQVLDPVLFNGNGYTPDEVIGFIRFPEDPIVENFLKNLTIAAKNPHTLDINLGKYITSLASERRQTVPTKSNMIVEFQSTPELDESINKLIESNPDALESINNAIGVDFGEVFGAVALASILQKVGNNHPEMLIKFPAESNCPLVDYFLEPKNKLQEFKISAKAGAGGKPTVNAPCSTILRMVDTEWGPEKESLRTRYADAIKFTRWLTNCMQTSTSVHNSFELIACALTDGSIDFLTGNALSMLESVKPIIEEIDALQSTGDIEVQLNALVQKTNEAIESLPIQDKSSILESGVWTKEKILKLKAEDMSPAERYFRSLKVKCLCTILINIINNSQLLIDFNDLFNMSFGTFIQVYFKQINIQVGSKYTLDAVVKSVDGQDIVGKDTFYKLNFDCAIDSQSGLFKVKSLALKLNHKRIKESRGIDRSVLREIIKLG